MKILIENRETFKKSGTFLIFLLCLLLISFELYALVLFHIEGNCPLPDNFGNFKRVRMKLDKDRGKGEFLFGVVGDTKGCGTFERIYEKLQNEPLAFLVLLGDCVRKGTTGYHSYFRAEWKDRKVPYPVFYVVGNHDVDQKRFSVSSFEQAYGPANFYFQYRNNLFVCLRILDAPYSNKQSLSFLENVLAKRRFLNKRVFLFMHIPPTVSPDYHVRSIEGEKRFVSLINKYHVDYVIGSDFHGYARVKVKGTVYLVTGGGGAHLKKVELGPFHHGIVFRVKKDSVSERILFVKRNEDFEDQLERYVLAEFIPWSEGNKPLAFIANAIVLLGLFFSFRQLTKHLKRGL